MGLINNIECFKIRIYKTNHNIFDFKHAKTIKTINCDSKSIFREPKTIIADPFLFVKNDCLYLFYEEKKLYKKGKIAMIKTKDLVHWTEPVIVLEEVCHLSYPWIFEENGHVYMIPETCGLNEIRIYEAENENLTSFVYKKTLMKNYNIDSVLTDYSDSSIYKNKYGFFLMTTVNYDGTNQLELYHSENLFGPYNKHKDSPISISNKYGRNGGCLFSYNGKLYRPAQDCVNGYGDNVHIRLIKEMTKNNYCEEEYIDNILSKTDVFYQKGGHQFNYVFFRDSMIVATDAKEYHSFLIQRVFQKLLNTVKK